MLKSLFFDILNDQSTHVKDVDVLRTKLWKLEIACLCLGCTVTEEVKRKSIVLSSGAKALCRLAMWAGTGDRPLPIAQTHHVGWNR